ncbi:uncharacterized protein EI97DRAFT_442835 [Westerdykella ornata]|uniref:Uncharacterized protein n=1 Tax=Westerdykella ornata TaxID=318751 RepID=A0A6A6JHZ3_WESOR|nr:uncharacterized protein EI97DRAFT_442835 [Westerdykella ornata]KAF2275845.1 hypothetical protein EI97DRAFT_442835 [Westerdykella ornata]
MPPPPPPPAPSHILPKRYTRDYCPHDSPSCIPLTIVIVVVVLVVLLKLGILFTLFALHRRRKERRARARANETRQMGVNGMAQRETQGFGFGDISPDAVQEDRKQEQERKSEECSYGGSGGRMSPPPPYEYALFPAQTQAEGIQRPEPARLEGRGECAVKDGRHCYSTELGCERLGTTAVDRTGSLEKPASWLIGMMGYMAEECVVVSVWRNVGTGRCSSIRNQQHASAPPVAWTRTREKGTKQAHLATLKGEKDRQNRHGKIYHYFDKRTWSYPHT